MKMTTLRRETEKCTRRVGASGPHVVVGGQLSLWISLRLVKMKSLDRTDSPRPIYTLCSQIVVTRNRDPTVWLEREVALEEGSQAIEAMDHGSPLHVVAMVTKFTSDAQIRNFETRALEGEASSRLVDPTDKFICWLCMVQTLLLDVSNVHTIRGPRNPPRRNENMPTSSKGIERASMDATQT